MAVTPPDLDVFLRTITWEEPDSLVSVLAAYLDMLVDRLHRQMAAEEASISTRTARQLETLERRLAGGSVSALTWPVIAGALLGRIGNGLMAADLMRMLRSPLITPFGEAPPLLRAPAWLRHHGPGKVLPLLDWNSESNCLEPAWELLNLCGEDIYYFVRTCTRVVTLRTTSQRDVTGSWSTDELIGCTVLVNFHRQRHPVWIAESLVHEAVHHCQSMFEVFRPFISHPSLAADETRYISPWTGASLTAKSLLGACFVWFSLAHFWERAGGVVDEGTRAVGLHKSVIGFVAADPAAEVRHFAWALDSQIPDLIAAIQATTRQRWPEC